ncbi:muconate cycloisomerase [Vibrio astriarenae]|nr:muconate cycloisomerase [Vibrio sp. C7]
MAPAFVIAQGVEIVDLDGPLLLSQDIDDGFVFTDNQMLPFTSKLWG